MNKYFYVCIVIILVAILGCIYFSPRLAFIQLQTAIKTNDVESLASQIDVNGIRAGLKNQMALRMQDAIRNYPSQPDLAATEMRLAPYFEAISNAIVTPASVLRELDAQMDTQDNVEQHFVGISIARISWVSKGKIYVVSFARRGLDWVLSSMSFPESMPKFWDQPTELRGVYHESHFVNCCFEGKESKQPYNDLQLSAAINILGVFGDDDAMLGVTQVQIGASNEMLNGIKDWDHIVVECKSLWLGNTGHYAHPAYCDAASIKLSN